MSWSIRRPEAYCSNLYRWYPWAIWSITQPYACLVSQTDSTIMTPVFCEPYKQNVTIKTIYRACMESVIMHHKVGEKNQMKMENKWWWSFTSHSHHQCLKTEYPLFYSPQVYCNKYLLCKSFTIFNIWTYLCYYNVAVWDSSDRLLYIK